jgi:Uncharacterized conserved protein (DUF2075)
MSVREITHSHAGIQNLTNTTQRILDLVKTACDRREKAICFVTGIPGAGKTLAGLNAVHDPTIREGGRPASVFMSGNGPLVEILREALALDCASRTGQGKDSARREVRTFIQNIHHFVEDNLEHFFDFRIPCSLAAYPEGDFWLSFRVDGHARHKMSEQTFGRIQQLLGTTAHRFRDRLGGRSNK